MSVDTDTCPICGGEMSGTDAYFTDAIFYRCNTKGCSTPGDGTVVGFVVEEDEWSGKSALRHLGLSVLGGVVWEGKLYRITKG